MSQDNTQTDTSQQEYQTIEEAVFGEESSENNVESAFTEGNTGNEETAAPEESGQPAQETTPDVNNDVSVGNVVCTYIKIPSSPVWAYSTIANGNAVYNATTSTQLTLPEHTHNEIAQRILSYIGISLREPEVQQYSAAKTKDKELQ